MPDVATFERTLGACAVSAPALRAAPCDCVPCGVGLQVCCSRTSRDACEAGGRRIAVGNGGHLAGFVTQRGAL